MKYCTKCLQPDTRPNAVFNESGQCPACNYHEEINEVDWEERYQILEELIEKYRKKSPKGFDCIIGVSGGKDSTRQALWVRDKLKMKPLLVCLSQPPQQINEIGVNNISNLIEQGFDVIYQALEPITWKNLMRESFLRFSNWARSTELAIYGSVPRMAIKYKIPLIFWGENPALQVGDMSVMGRNGYDGNNLRNSNTLSTGHGWMIDAGYEREHILNYIFPSKEEFEINQLQVVYLGWFLGNWSLIENGMYSSTHGLEIRDAEAKDTGDNLGVSNLDEDWHNMNQMIKYYKFGFGKTTECVCESIRDGKMSRKEGIELIELYDGKCSDKYIHSFCEYIEITKEDFWEIIHKNMNQKLFRKREDGSIERLFKVGEGL